MENPIKMDDLGGTPVLYTQEIVTSPAKILI
jgi:hypothetical protein